MSSYGPPPKKSRREQQQINGDDDASVDQKVDVGKYLDQYVNNVYNEEDIEFNHTFKMQKWRQSFVIEELPTGNPEDLLRLLFQKCIEDAKIESRKNGIEPDSLGLTIASRLLSYDIWIPIRPITENTVEAALNRFKLVAQSKTNEGNLLGEPFSITITTIDKKQLSSAIQRQKLDGSGNGDHQATEVQHRISRKCLIPVKNSSDNYCLFHALYLTYTRKMGILTKQNFYNLVHRDHSRRQKEVEELMINANIPLGESSYQAKLYVPKIVKFWNDMGKERQLRYKVFIFDSSGEDKPSYTHGHKDFNVPIVLYFHPKHFWGVRSVASLFEDNNYCLACLSPYAKLHRKDCSRLCLNCGRIGLNCSFSQNEINYEKFCIGCSKNFIDKNCYEIHLKNNFCNESKKCLACGVIWNVEANTRNGRAGHQCLERYCKTCDCFHSKERMCYIQPLKPHEQLPLYRCVAFDFETIQERVVDVEKGKKIHEINFAAATVFCRKCIEANRWQSSLSKQKPCPICGPNRTITFSHRPFVGTDVDKQVVTENPLREFVRWIIYDLPLEYTTVAFAHYGGRFDVPMVFREIFNMNAKSSLIRRGNKLYQLLVEAVSRKNPLVLFRDSYNLFPIALGKLIGAFGLSGIKDKPFFPYLANSQKYYDVTLPELPPPELYLYKGFMPKKKEEFERWYADNRHTKFTLNNELASYCVNDIKILASALVAFRREFLEISAGKTHNKNHLGIDPLRDGITISSNCLLNFRLNHLRSDEHLGVVPHNGYDTCDSQSTLALKYFKWYSETYDVELQTAHNGGERTIGKYQLDAYYETKNGDKIGIECKGCVFHAHKCRFPDDNQLIKPVGKTAGWIRERDAHREQFLQRHLTRLDIIYECEINEMLKKDKNMKSMFDNYMDEGPIQIREQGFFGGRTGPFKIYHEKQQEEHIGYLDFRSLYPATNFNTSYPIKHPKVLKFVGKQQKVLWTEPKHCNYQGFVKCFVVPPVKCAVPVLPVKFDERLLFPLCRSCSLKYPEGRWMLKYSCPHTIDQERGWISTATTIEIREALRVGYKVTRLFRVLNYPEDQWDDSLFKKYVADFMTIKTHSSGFPDGISTEEQQEQFVRECREKFGMQIEKDKMIRNDARRTLSKLCLNSLWGRFSLRNDLCRSVITSSLEELYKFLNNNTIDICSLDELKPNTILITYETKKEFIVENEGSNVVLSAWTTSAARIKLLNAMQRIVECPGCELLYTDTDSCIYTYKIGMNPLETGHHLGDLASEVPPGYEIVEFICAGAKQYGIKLRKLGAKTGDTDEFEYILKLRGFSLNYQASLILNYETFKQQVLSFARGQKPGQGIGITYPHFIRPDIRTGTVTSSSLTKYYKPVLSKGILGPDFRVRTFGQKE